MKSFVIASLMLVGVAGLGFGAAAPARALPAGKIPSPQAEAPSVPLTLIHGWHCRRAWAPGWGRHYHPRACRRRHYQRRWRRGGPRFVCWFNRWGQRVCRRRW